MKKINYLLIFVLGILLFSCTSKFDVGEDLIDTQSGITIIDTFQVRLSTVKLDSLPTSGATQLLCGKYSTNLTGSTEFIPYFNFDLGSQITSITEDDILDSMTLRLRYSGYYIGDTTQLQTFSLYRLTEYLDFIDDDRTGDYIYNINSFPHEEVPLGRISFYPHVVRDDSIEFRLDNTLANTLINMVLTDADETDADKFNEYLKGFVLKSAAGSKSILGFTGDTAGVKLNIYTRIVGPGESQKKRYVLPLSAEKTYYHQAVSDRSGTYFAELKLQDEEILARNSGDRSFIAGGAGIVTRIDFPSLNNVFLYNDRVMIKAELVLIPSVENNVDFLPGTLQFYASNKHNVLGSTLVSGSQQTPVQATLQKRDAGLYPDIYNLYYAVDITQYLTSEFSGNYYNTDNGLLISVPYSNLQTRADLLILNGENVTRYKPQLKLYFLKYE